MDEEERKWLATILQIWSNPKSKIQLTILTFDWFNDDLRKANMEQSNPKSKIQRTILTFNWFNDNLRNANME